MLVLFSVLSLLSQVTKKMVYLYGMSSGDIDEESERRAKISYQNYVANVHSHMRFGDDDVEATGELYWIQFSPI